MKTILNKLLLIAVASLGFVTLVSCSDDDDATLDRLFRPILKDVVTGLGRKQAIYDIGMGQVCFSKHVCSKD